MGYSLDLLKQIAHGLAQQFSDSCEIVIHDVRHGIENTLPPQSTTHRPAGIFPLTFRSVGVLSCEY